MPTLVHPSLDVAPSTATVSVMRNAPTLLSYGLFTLSLTVMECDEQGIDTERFSAIVELEGEAAVGESLYASDCAGCHGADGRGGSAPSIAGEETDESIEASLEGPDDMPKFDHWTDQELADVAQFVSEL